jgi:hypothetical protein
MKDRTAGGLSGWFAATILLGAFLLFQVQPLFGKLLLPWFGGSPAVWTTCLMFFQMVLLVGYAYAYGLSRLRPVSRQLIVHGTLCSLALLLLPITPGESWQPADGTHPIERILLLLTRHVGLPYLLLAATSPLVQSWFATVYAKRTPYRLYALSNLGSLVGLLSYPFIVEPRLTTDRQGMTWSVAFGVYAVLCGVLAVRMRRLRLPGIEPPRKTPISEHPAEPTAGRHAWAWWILLSALGSVLLMSITNHVCQNVAVIPLLWIVPLAIYLVTFIICFDKEHWYVRRWFAAAAMLAVLAASYLVLFRYLDELFLSLGLERLWFQLTHNIVVEATVYLLILFLLCMVCHGELVQRKPPPRRLTAFYLAVSGGGALGGILVAVVSPLVFSSYLELNLGLLAGFGLALFVFADEARTHWLPNVSRLLRAAALTLALAASAIVAWGQWEAWDREGGLLRVRNFYGVMSVKERYPQNPQWRGLALYHGRTLHGFELLQPELRGKPTTYYTEDSGVGRALTAARESGPLRVGVVGLGVGTLAAYGQPGDYFRFYEIDEDVIRLARRHFSFLPQSAAEIDVVAGDARVSLEREPPQQFHVLVLDAFTGDSIPVHLLTVEVFASYLRHLRDDGVIAAHISSRYVNLVPVVTALARHCELAEAYVVWPPVGVSVKWADEHGLSLTQSQWMLLARDRRILERSPIQEATQVSVGDGGPLRLWTDQSNNLLEVLR